MSYERGMGKLGDSSVIKLMTLGGGRVMVPSPPKFADSAVREGEMTAPKIEYTKIK